MENILLKVIQAADGDIERAEHGSSILMRSIRSPENRRIRPLPVMCRARACSSAAEDHRRNGGFRAAPGRRKHPHQELIQIDTTNILFICGGAFEGIDKIIETRLDRKSIGFNAEIAEEA